MNIMHVVFSFNNGGIENLLVDILNNWGGEVDNQHLCIINNNYDTKLIKKINIKKSKIFLMNRPVGGEKIKYIQNFNKYVRENKIDLVHCHSNPAVKFCVPVKILNPNIKLVYTVHDTMIYSELKRYDVLVHKIFLNKIIVISKSVYDSVIKKYKNINRISIVYNGVDYSKFMPRQKGNNQYRIGCIARLDPIIKGQDVLLNAIKILKEKKINVQCVIVGEAPKEKPSILDELKNVVNELNISDRVFFTGNSNDVPKVLSTLDILILPSRKEGFGLAIIEAFFSKVPVIASNTEGPKELIKDNLYGDLFESNDYNDLADKIENVLKMNVDIKVERAFNYAMNNFSIKRMINNLSNIYTNI